MKLNLNSKKARAILHVLFPTKCPVCGHIIHYMERFCSECTDKFSQYKGNFSIDGADKFFASFEYDDNISPAIILMKEGTCGNADYALGNELADTIINSMPEFTADLIVPVPMHKEDVRERSYNQAELLCRVISERLRIPCNTNLVTKNRVTEKQKTLTKAERAVNLLGAFSVSDKSAVQNKTILIIDDVCTTGATLAEIVKLLKNNGADKVYCACCCKTPEINKTKGSV